VFKGKKPYLLSWQSYPLILLFPPYNINTYDLVDTNSFVSAVDTGKIHMAAPLPAREGLRGLMEIFFASLVKSSERLRGKTHPSPDEPVATIVHPIVLNGTVVGILTTSLLWRELMENKLPPGSPPVDVVANQCGQIYTYTVHGSKVEGRGEGDLHSGRLNRLAVTSEYMLDPNDVDLPVNNEFCPSSITVYPTEEFLDDFNTPIPTILAGVVLAVFLVTSTTFIIYDRRVERRQRLVLLEASKNATNEALLEEKVHERTHTLGEMNRELEKANKNIQHASEAQLRHFACMSHEIRTPLNCIMGCSSLLIATPLEDVQRDSVQMILSSGEELLTVINNVLEYSRLETGNVEFEVQSAQLQGIIDESVWPIVAKHKDINILTHFDVATPEYLRTDPRRLQEVFTKLLKNAISRSKSGDTVLFTLKVDIRKDRLTISVRDQGPKMSEDECVDIHKPFRQDGEVNGLGVAISSKLVNQMGGSVKVFSYATEGAIFVISFSFTQEESNELTQALEKVRGTQLIMCTSVATKSFYFNAIAKHYKIPIACVDNQADAITEDSKLPDSKQRIVLIQSDLFEAKEWQQSRSRHIVTFGTNDDSKVWGGHSFANLEEQLPTTLIQSLVSVLDRSRSERLLPTQNSMLSEGDIEVPYGSLRLLIAEDNLVNQKVLARLLKRLGAHNVSIVSNGRQAVDKEAEEEFDYVFMDMQMPIMDGLEATRCIQERTEGHKRARIIFITAHALLDFQDQCFKAGGIEFVAKPCSMDAINQCFKRIYLRDKMRK